VKIIINYEKFLKKSILTKLIPLLMVILLVITAGTFVYIKRKPITVITDGKKLDIVTYKSNVRQALETNNIHIDKKDKVNPPLNTPLKKNSSIFIKKAIGVKVYVDGKVLNVKSAETNIEAMLNAENIAVAKVDKVAPALKTPLTKGMKINITRVKSKLFTKHIKLNYRIVVRINNSLPNTIRKVITEGHSGDKKITTKVVYHNGKTVSKKIISQIITNKPVNTLIIQGGYMKLPVALNGKVMAYTKKFNVRATAYWAVRGVGRTFTGSGRMAIRNTHGYSTVAVDRHLLPYGTKMFIEGYGFAVAADTGSAILGKTIDVYFNTRREACSWGVKHPTVYVLK
jgi:uncharacterized protein YabE (DUF348 family)